jgi:hypothetical protein
MLKDLVQRLRSFKGLKRKATLRDILTILGEEVYDDAGWFDGA